MSSSPASEPAPDRRSASKHSSLPESDSTLRRRKLLRMAAGGVPLLSASPVSARLAASSAFRAARNDAKLNPPMITAKQDGWIRARIDVVEVRLKTPGSQPPDKKPREGGGHRGGNAGGPGNGGVGNSAGGPGFGNGGGNDHGGGGGLGGGGFGGGPGHAEPGILAYKFGDPPRYTQVSGLMQINSLFVEEVRRSGHVYSLVLFDKSGGIHGVDPGRMLGNGLQGLHYSSWRSISPNGQSFPGYHAGV